MGLHNMFASCDIYLSNQFDKVAAKFQHHGYSLAMIKLMLSAFTAFLVIGYYVIFVKDSVWGVMIAVAFSLMLFLEYRKFEISYDYYNDVRLTQKLNALTLHMRDIPLQRIFRLGMYIFILIGIPPLVNNFTLKNVVSSICDITMWIYLYKETCFYIAPDAFGKDRKFVHKLASHRSY